MIKKIILIPLILGTLLNAKPFLTAGINILYNAYTFGYEGSTKNGNLFDMKGYCQGAYLGGIYQMFYINTKQILDSCYLGGMYKIRGMNKLEKNKFNSHLSK